MKSSFLALFLLPSFLLPLSLLSQDKFEKEFQKQYEINIQLEYINDIYIPSDVSDAMKQLDLLSNEAGRAKLIEAEEQIAAERLVHGLGKWMLINWNLFEGSRLSHMLKDYGVTHPDDMCRFLIVSYHRYLKQVPLELEERGKILWDFRKKEQERRNALKKIID